MTVQDNGQVTDSAAEVYEMFYLPALFQRWTGPVLDAAQVKPGDDILDVACGTGILARDATRVIGATDSATGVDINPGMLTVARDRGPGLTWIEEAAENLPFDDAQFDAVVSQFGMMFFVDRQKAVAEMVRVLKPGQYLAVAVWDSLENTPGYAALVDLLEELFGSEVAQGLRSPYVLGHKEQFRSYFDHPDLTDIHIETIHQSAEFHSIKEWVFTDVKGWVISDALGPAEFKMLQRAAEEKLTRFTQPDGRVMFDAPAHILSAQKVN